MYLIYISVNDVGGSNGVGGGLKKYDPAAI